jgi:manganese transport protein
MKNHPSPDGHGKKSLADYHGSVDTTQSRGWFRKLFAFIGPAYLVSVGYMDPGNWATDIAGGSKFGYALLWVLVLSNITAIFVQSHSARIGLVTGKDLAQLSRAYFPRWLNFIFWIMAEIAIAATDLAEVLGMAIGLNLLFGLPLLVGVGVTVFDTFLVMFLLKKGMRRLEAFILGLITVISVSFVIELVWSHPSGPGILSGLMPAVPNDEALYIAIGIIGATVMPHNLFLHSSLVQTRKYAPGPAGLKRAIKLNIVDTIVALNIALFVNAAILILAASAFHAAGRTDVIDIANAHQLLAPLLGTSLAPVLFAIALIASGQSSTLTGTLTGQIVMEGYLNIRIAPALRRLITRLVAVAPALIVIALAGDRAAGTLLVLSQVILSLALGFIVIPLIHWVSSKKIAGDFRIRPVNRIISWALAGTVVVLNMKMVYDTVAGWVRSSSTPIVPALLVGGPCLILAALLVFLAVEPLFRRFGPAPFKTTHVPPENLRPAAPAGCPGLFRKIAVSVDFSEADGRAVAAALAQGGAAAEYFLIHSVESAGARLMRSEIFDTESIEDRGYLEGYARELAAGGYRSAAVVEFGLAKDVLPRAVRRLEADLLIMSSHKHSFWGKLFKGTTIDRVQRNIAVPMIIIK